MKKWHGNLNISGLHNKKQSTASDPDLVHTENDAEDQETPKDFGIQFDSTCIDWANSEGNADEESDDEEVLKNDAYGDEQFTLQLAALTEEYDPMDQDWVPAKYCRERQVKKGERNKTIHWKYPYKVTGRPKMYSKGPGFADKAPLTQCQLAAEWADQSSLKSWFSSDLASEKGIWYALDMVQEAKTTCASKHKRDDEVDDDTVDVEPVEDPGVGI